MQVSRRSLMRLMALSTLSATSTGLVTSCGSQVNQSLTVGMVTFPGYAPLYVAKHFSLFSGVDVNLVRIESIGDLRAAMLSGRIDAYLATYDIFQSIQGRAPIGKMIYAIDTSVGADGVVVDEAIKDVSGLLGQRIGAEPGFPPHFVLTYMLYKIGHRLSDVTLLDMPSGDVPSAFASGQISVAATYEPYLSKCLTLKQGAKVLVSSKDVPGLVTDFIVASDSAIASKSEALKKLIQGWNSALEKIKAQPNEAFPVMAQAFSVPVSDMRAFADVVKWLSLSDNQAMFRSPDDDSVYSRFREVNQALRLNDGKVFEASAKDYVSDKFVLG